MTTTTPNPTRSIITASDVYFAAPRETRQLARLLQMREQLARYSTERESHGLDDSDLAFAAMISVEDEIADVAPVVHAALFPLWVNHAMGVAHAPGVFNPRCGICMATVDRPTASRDDDTEPLTGPSAE